MHKDADSIQVIKSLKIAFKGIFDMTDLYKQMKFWLNGKGYGDETKDFKENVYVERIKGDSKQIEIKWISEKKVSDYFRNQIVITFFVLGLKDAEADWKRKKIKMDQGDIELNLSSNLITNANGKWNNKSFMKRFYERFVVKDRTEGYKIELYKDTYDLHNLIKSIFELRKF